MLVSHTRKFIYLKTIKTGSTSVEIYFERWCLDPAKRPGADIRNAEVSSWGIVGSRGEVDDPIWYNHVPAGRIRELIGEAVWTQYHKFCVVRNPFDKVVSTFWFSLPPVIGEMLKKADFSVVRKAFADWIGPTILPVDRSIYTIGGKPAVDQFIRFENLHADLERVCDRLGVPWNPRDLGKYKGEFRVRSEHFSEYYTAGAAARVSSAFSWDLEYFGYALSPDAAGGHQTAAV